MKKTETTQGGHSQADFTAHGD
jgi:hypothetical protein